MTEMLAATPVSMRPIINCLDRTLVHLELEWWAVAVLFAAPFVVLVAAVSLPGRSSRWGRIALGVVLSAQIIGVVVQSLDGPGSDPQAMRVWRWFLATAAGCWLVTTWLVLDAVAKATVRDKKNRPRRGP